MAVQSLLSSDLKFQSFFTVSAMALTPTFPNFTCSFKPNKPLGTNWPPNKPIKTTVGKIPRRSSSSSGGVKGDKDFSRVENDKVLSESEERRRERRERAKLKKQVDKGKDKIEIVMKSKDGFVNRVDGGVRLEGSKPGRVDHQQDCRVENSSRFPGRESLLKKVLSRKNVL
ncbi:hypothetical protein OIU84_020313 [Salix udensis]|uniref:Uncharacterized protein n=1 Tax=Salix udensis TaxID=889485 RepID=A0AAD6KTI5_9ROSI|nr:hypothetical protein OIU84_020313 [Salix udensis]